jgi:hypothetical protein
MPAPTIEWIAAALFAVALLHTFAAKQFERLSRRFPRHAVAASQPILQAVVSAIDFLARRLFRTLVAVAAFALL